MTRLAWLYLQRNDPRAKTVLERTQQIGGAIDVPDEIAGMLAQSWGELARRSGQLREALQHKQRALNIFERVGDRRSVLATWLNLSSIYAELQQFDRAIDYAQRILEVAARQDVEPQIVAGTHVNLGATYYLQGRYDAAIEQYQLALDASAAQRPAPGGHPRALQSRGGLLQALPDFARCARRARRRPAMSMRCCRPRWRRAARRCWSWRAS